MFVIISELIIKPKSYTLYISDKHHMSVSKYDQNRQT